VDRRRFLGALATFAVGAALDPELLVWKPGAKTIFLPSIVAFSQSDMDKAIAAVVKALADAIDRDIYRHWALAAAGQRWN
jgi:hypothetical protein